MVKPGLALRWNQGLLVRLKGQRQLLGAEVTLKVSLALLKGNEKKDELSCQLSQLALHIARHSC